MTTPTTILVLDTNVDTVELLRHVLTEAGFLVTSAFVDELTRGEADLDPMLKMHPPAAVLYDVAIPYDRNWAFQEQLRQQPELRDVPFVLTTTNVGRLRAIVTDAAEPDMLEIIEKPYELEQVVAAVKRAVWVDGLNPDSSAAGPAAA